MLSLWSYSYTDWLYLKVVVFSDHFKCRRQLCKLQKGCTRLASASDKVYQLLAQGRWFSSGTPASSTTKTGRHDIAEILLKVALRRKPEYPKRTTDPGQATGKLYHLRLRVECTFFSSPDPKGHVSYCHHLASVVVVRPHNFETRHPSDDSDQVWFPLVLYFQRRRFLKKFTTYDGRTTTTDAK
jgi:hypothetical protein